MESPQGVVVITLATIYETVKDVPELVKAVSGLDTDQKVLAERLRKSELELAAHRVIIGIITAVIIAQQTGWVGK